MKRTAPHYRALLGAAFASALMCGTALAGNPPPVPFFSAPAALQSSTQASDFAFSQMLAPADTIQNTASTVFGVSLLSLKDILPGGHLGGRNVITAEVDLNGPSGSTSPNRNYVGGYLRGIANSGDGGSAGNYLGAVFGSNPVVACNAGATFLLDCSGEEIDSGMYAGASSAYRLGQRIASFGTAKGTLLDAGIEFTTLDTHSTGFGRGIVFGSFGGSPNPVSGILISAAGDGQVALTATAGIDFSGYTFTGYSMAMPGGFALYPTGQLVTPNFSATASIFPKVVWNATANAVDQKQWQAYTDATGNWIMTSLNDASNAAAATLEFFRGVGNVVTGATVTPPLTAAGGITVTGAPSGNTLYATGSYGFGLNLNAATFTSYAIISAGFNVNPTGNISTTGATVKAATLPKLTMSASSNATDQKQAQLYLDGTGDIILTTVNDASSAVAPAMEFFRGTGYTLASATIFPLLSLPSGITGLPQCSTITAGAGVACENGTTSGSAVIVK